MTDKPDPNLGPRQRDVLELLRDYPEGSLQAGDIADELGISSSSVKTHIQTLRSKGFRIYSSTDNDSGYAFDPTELADPDHDDLVKILRDGGATMADLTAELDTSRSSIHRAFQRLREQNYLIEHETVDASGTRHFYIADQSGKAFAFGDGDGTYRFALISDTHLGSKASHLDDLHDFYDRLVDRGIDTVFHGGDISDGWDIHRDQVNHLRPEAIGWGRMKQYVIDNYPQRDGIDTFFIEGNHDHAYYKENGIYIGKEIAHQRDDLHWLGDSVARIILDPDNDIDLELIHPSGGQPYTLGYRAQTLNRERDKDELPTIQGIAHLHGKLWASAEGVDHALYTGCWKSLTTWGKRKGHAGQIGGYIIELEIADGEVKRFLPEWIDYPTREVGETFTAQDLADIAGR